MPRPPIYNGFLHLTPNHHTHGFWRTSEGQVQYGYTKLDPYIDVVQTLERGLFDTLFIADVVGVYDLDFGDGTTTIRAGTQFPEPDPVSIVSALGYATEHLGITVTSNIIQSHPFTFARQLSSLDHFTDGRVAWNIVTSCLSNGFGNFGYDSVVGHDERYEWAQEFADVTYKLWEQSWQDGVVLHDAATNRFLDPQKLHTIDHVGPRDPVQEPHIVEPSLQRTPALFHAGNSTAGVEFEAVNAEGDFLPSQKPQTAREDIDILNAHTGDNGRNPESLKKIVTLSTIIGSTEEARRKERYFHDNIDFPALPASWRGGSGIDLASVDPETPLSELGRRAQLGEHIRSVFRAAAESLSNPESVSCATISRSTEMASTADTPAPRCAFPAALFEPQFTSIANGRINIDDPQSSGTSGTSGKDQHRHQLTVRPERNNQ